MSKGTAMQGDILAEAQRLRDERRPFALATVVAAKAPTSGAPGERAIVLPSGELRGWIGGHCAQPAVVQQGLAALSDGAPRLVVLRPDAQPDNSPMAGVVEVPMMCASQGELQVFVEPFLPRIELVVVGASAVARALARLGGPLDFDIWACDPEADMEMFPEAQRLVLSLDDLKPQLTVQNYVIVATINSYDEEAVRAALGSEAGYVGVVASVKRFAAIQETLREQGVSEEQLERLRRPKGLPGPALRPSEIAFSILAELIEVRRQHVAAEAEAPASPRPEAIDPICGMTVDVATARFTSERDGQTYYFCSKGCQERFEAQKG
jgi:xanthine dehydrogenase accessory factor